MREYFLVSSFLSLLCAPSVGFQHVLPRRPPQIDLDRSPAFHPQRTHTIGSGKQGASTETELKSISELSHCNILWKIKVPPSTPWMEKLRTRLASRLLYLDFLRQSVDPPRILCPNTSSQQIEVQAYLHNKQIGRFGISVTPGPPLQALQETVRDLYSISPDSPPASAAIIYMFVEPEFRKRKVGALALEVISLIHATQNCDFTVLVADDKGSGKLVGWYEREGNFQRAPKLQEPFGSPDGKYGVTMIAPTDASAAADSCIQWW